MKAGDYVRVNTKTMVKYVGITRLESETDFAYYFKDLTILKRPDRRSKKVVDINEFNYKSSPNIIDLIEVGDYVNGHRVIDIAKDQIRALYYEDISQKYALIPMINKDIKSIVTKEQFESIKYEVK